jgi:type IV pilus assembly protein PilB
MASKLRDILVNDLGISVQDYEACKVKAQEQGISLMYALENAELVPEDKLLEAFASIYNCKVAKLGDMEIPPNFIQLLPRDLATKYRVIPFDRAGNNIIVAMADTTKLEAIDAIRFKTGYAVKPVLASERKISAAIEKYYASRLDMGKITGGEAGESKEPKKDENRIVITKDSADGPVIKLVNTILTQCLERKASDIHIEPYEEFMRIRLRTDGTLREILRPPGSIKEALIQRFKIMSKLDIAEKRKPQDGAIQVEINGKPIDFRVSTVPTNYGEKIVLRILDKSALNVDMTKLGFEQDDLDKFMGAIHKPFGMVLVTGPTGSGKTTTLYSAIAELNKETENIMTAEDPVEFQLPGVNQVQMKNEVGLTFASALKAFLRQDPDVILVGEIRDLETAEIAIKAALTGHMVLSTLHTNSASDTISRLLNMGLESFNLVSALNAIVAQRLMKRICPHCRVEDPEVTPEVMVQLGIHPSYATQFKAYKGKGCEACHNIGTKGRVAVHEVLAMSDPIKEAILKNLPAMHIKRVAMANGMRSMRQNALNKMIQGIAPASEVIKNTASDSNNDKQAKPGAAAA